MLDAGIREVLDQNLVIGEPRSGPRRFWTGREEKILRKHYPDVGVPGCLALLPGRSASSIYNHANQLGLRASAARRKIGNDRWSVNEQIDRVIRDVYQRKPTNGDIKKLAQTVGRPRWWVSKRAQKLGLTAPRFREPEWSEAEIDIIAERAHKSPKTIRKYLANKGFERTETAIIVKLKRLGQSTGREADPNHYTATHTAGLFGVDTKTVTRWIDKGWLKAKRRGTERTAQQGGDEWWIHRRDIRRFIIENTAAVDIRKVEKFWFVDLLARSA